MDALSLLFVVANTIGLITPLALTFIHDVFPLSIALLRSLRFLSNDSAFLSLLSINSCKIHKINISP